MYILRAYVNQTHLINNNVFHNHISFIIGIITNAIYIMSYQNENNPVFLNNSKGNKNINFLIKIIYNILCIIKKYIKFENYSFSYKKTFANLLFFLFSFFNCTIKNTEKRI